MTTWAIVENDTIVNVILADAEPNGVEAVELTGPMGIGWTRSEGDWSPPTTPQSLAPRRVTKADFTRLWDRCTTPDEGEISSFTIITGPSEGWLSDYHDRAPMILEPDEWGLWLDPANDPEAIMRAVRPERFSLGGDAAA